MKDLLDANAIAEFMKRRVYAAIRERPLCVPCIGREVALREAVIRDAIQTAPVDIPIRRGERVCERCTVIRQTYVIMPPRVTRA
jgi:hypothetical protein